jgi:hypothetical protein
LWIRGLRTIGRGGRVLRLGLWCLDELAELSVVVKIVVLGLGRFRGVSFLSW